MRQRARWSWETFSIVTVTGAGVLKGFFGAGTTVSLVIAAALATCLALEENPRRLELPRKLRYEK